MVASAPTSVSPSHANATVSLPPVQQSDGSAWDPHTAAPSGVNTSAQASPRRHMPARPFKMANHMHVAKQKQSGEVKGGSPTGGSTSMPILPDRSLLQDRESLLAAGSGWANSVSSTRMLNLRQPKLKAHPGNACTAAKLSAEARWRRRASQRLPSPRAVSTPKPTPLSQGGSTWEFNAPDDVSLSLGFPNSAPLHDARSASPSNRSLGEEEKLKKVQNSLYAICCPYADDCLGIVVRWTMQVGAGG
mmetsp:Transcript_15976/g.29236  ORF Transcript_15976/g.29236 Transcript_15976/m.29236 type:complete len:247 (-) Transcript_15976:57-797(-)